MPDDLAHWIALSCVAGLGPARLARLIRQLGSPASILAAPVEQLTRVRAIDAPLARGILQAGRELDRFARLAEQLAAEGISVVTQADAAYPRLLLRAPNPPAVIYLAGTWRPADENSVGIIGSTHPSDQALEVARQCGRRLAGLGCTIVSGYAHGIDSAGHLGALDAGGRTIFVLPTGIRSFASRTGFPELDTLLRHGAALSEAPPDDGWHRIHALARNRLTAALSRRLLVVETGAVGGTMHTARIARRIGVPVYVIQYRTAAPGAEGNELLRCRGAVPIRCYADIDRLAAGELAPGSVTQKTFDW